jgi:hypothetical protein
MRPRSPPGTPLPHEGEGLLAVDGLPTRLEVDARVADSVRVGVGLGVLRVKQAHRYAADGVADPIEAEQSDRNEVVDRQTAEGR